MVLAPAIAGGARHPLPRPAQVLCCAFALAVGLAGRIPVAPIPFALAPVTTPAAASRPLTLASPTSAAARIVTVGTLVAAPAPTRAVIVGTPLLHYRLLDVVAPAWLRNITGLRPPRPAGVGMPLAGVITLADGLASLCAVGIVWLLAAAARVRRVNTPPLAPAVATTMTHVFFARHLPAITSNPVVVFPWLLALCTSAVAPLARKFISRTPTATAI